MPKNQISIAHTSLVQNNQKKNEKETTSEDYSHQNKVVKYSGLGVMVGFTTFPIDEDIPCFYENEVEKLFNWYKKSLNSNLLEEKDSDFIKYVYKPKAYYIFGKFDLIFISLIDDYEICGRTFRPFNSEVSHSSSG